MNKTTIAAMTVAAISLTACLPDAQVASDNLSKSANMFEVQRRIVFYNGINGEYMLTIEGRCSISPSANRLDVTCKNGPNEFEKHFLGLSDNVTYFAEQTELADVSVYHNRIIWKPQSIIPDVDLNVDIDELTNDRN